MRSTRSRSSRAWRVARADWVWRRRVERLDRCAARCELSGDEGLGGLVRPGEREGMVDVVGKAVSE